MSSSLLHVPSIPLFDYALYNIIRGSQHNKEHENTYNSATSTRVIQIRTLIWVERTACTGLRKKNILILGSESMKLREH